jgi:hypothetical protein
MAVKNICKILRSMKNKKKEGVNSGQWSAKPRSADYFYCALTEGYFLQRVVGDCRRILNFRKKSRRMETRKGKSNRRSFDYAQDDKSIEGRGFQGSPLLRTGPGARGHATLCASCVCSVFLL